jgi:hypothetical protein
LLERLNKGVYPDICNYNEEIFNKLLDKNKEEEQEEEEEEVYLIFGLVQKNISFTFTSIMCS